MLQERNMSASRLRRLTPEKGLPGRLQHPCRLLHNCVEADDYDTLKWLLKFDEGKRRQLSLKHVAYSNVYTLSSMTLCVFPAPMARNSLRCLYSSLGKLDV